MIQELSIAGIIWCGVTIGYFAKEIIKVKFGEIKE